jgi:hypothetical protein
MIFVLGVIGILNLKRYFSRLEEKITSQDLENHAGEAPDIRAGIIISAQNDFRRPVLSGLDLSGEVMMTPARIAEVGNLDAHILIDRIAFFVQIIEHLLLGRSLAHLGVHGDFALPGLLLSEFFVLFLLFFASVLLLFRSQMLGDGL